MTTNNSVILTDPVGYIKPREIAARDELQISFISEVHFTFWCAYPQSCHGVNNDPQAQVISPFILPVIGFVAIHPWEQFLAIILLQGTMAYWPSEWNNFWCRNQCSSSSRSGASRIGWMVSLERFFAFPAAIVSRCRSWFPSTIRMASPACLI